MRMKLWKTFETFKNQSRFENNTYNGTYKLPNIGKTEIFI